MKGMKGLDEMKALEEIEETYCISDRYVINRYPEHHVDVGFAEEGQLEVYTFAEQIMKDNNFKTVIDVGCGSGYKLIKYLGKYETIGIETEPCYSNLLNKYPDRKWLLSGDPEEDFVHYDLACDLIICSDVVEHITNPDVLIDYLLKFNAKYYIISTPCRDILCNNSKHSPVYKSSWKGPPINPCHVREWTMKEFQQYLKPKFEIIQSLFGKEQVECQYHLLKKQVYNLAFYTCFYGSNENVAFQIPEVPSVKYNCYYYTNNTHMMKLLKNTNWIGILDDNPTTDDLIESCRVGKEVKVLPENFKELKNYHYTCFLDSKLAKVSETFVESYINQFFIEKNYALILRTHWFIGGNVWDEYDESTQPRYLIEKEKYKAYILKRIENGLSETTATHCACGFLIRNMQHEQTKLINNTWYEHIQECGIQDQISFFFVKQLFSNYIHSFTKNPFC